MAVKVTGIERDIRNCILILILKSRRNLGKYFPVDFLVQVNSRFSNIYFVLICFDLARALTYD